MKTTLCTGYQYIGVTEGVCGSEVIVTGTRLKPEQVVVYGSLEDAVEDFDLTVEQVEECYWYCFEKH